MKLYTPLRFPLTQWVAGVVSVSAICSRDWRELSSADGQSEFHPPLSPFQIHEKEEEEFNEKSEHDSGIK